MFSRAIATPAGMARRSRLVITRRFQDRPSSSRPNRSMVMASPDIAEATSAYRRVLRANLAFRRLGVMEALEQNPDSRIGAKRAAQSSLALDSHLADVSRFVARLLVANEQPAGSILLLETAARLYGPRTPRGQESLALARQIERRYLR